MINIVKGWYCKFTGTCFDKRTIQYRMNICQRCEFRKKDKCQLCGCVISAKVLVKDEECPKHKW